MDIEFDMIINLTPYRLDKNIGKAYNEQIERLNLKDDDWIIINDRDILYLTPTYFDIITQVSKQTDYELLGAMTNRVGIEPLLHDNFSNDHNILNHIEIALEREKTHKYDIKEVDLIAGYFMMFKYGTWKKYGGFKERVLNADIMFCKKIKTFRGKIGVMKGLYVYHAYRPEYENIEKAKESFVHLQ